MSEQEFTDDWCRLTRKLLNNSAMCMCLISVEQYWISFRRFKLLFYECCKPLIRDRSTVFNFFAVRYSFTPEIPQRRIIVLHLLAAFEHYSYIILLWTINFSPKTSSTIYCKLTIPLFRYCAGLHARTDRRTDGQYRPISICGYRLQARSRIKK